MNPPNFPSLCLHLFPITSKKVRNYHGPRDFIPTVNETQAARQHQAPNSSLVFTQASRQQPTLIFPAIVDPRKRLSRTMIHLDGSQSNAKIRYHATHAVTSCLQPSAAQYQRTPSGQNHCRVARCWNLSSAALAEDNRKGVVVGVPSCPRGPFSLFGPPGSEHAVIAVKSSAQTRKFTNFLPSGAGVTTQLSTVVLTAEMMVGA